MKKFIIFFAIIICGYNANAKTTESSSVYITCPAGFFCTANGKYYTTSSITTGFGVVAVVNDEIPPYMYGPAELWTPAWGMMSDEQFGKGYAFDPTTYDQVWVSDWFGFYGIKNGEVTYHSWWGTSFQGVFPCPGTYPNSTAGAASVFDCYRIKRSNGQRQVEYYTTPTNTQNSNSGNTANLDASYNTDDVNALLTTLQSALDQANTAARNLQNILAKSNSHIMVDVPIKIPTNLSISTADQATATKIDTQKVKDTKSSDNTTVNTTSSTANNKTITTQSTTEKTPSVTTIANKTDFSSLSSIFNTDKAAVHKQTAGRVAIPKKIQRKAITNTTGQQRRMATKHQNARFGNSKKPTLTR